MAGDKDKKKKRSSKKGSKDRAKSRAKPLDAEAFDRAATTLNDATAKLMRAAERHEAVDEHGEARGHGRGHGGAVVPRVVLARGGAHLPRKARAAQRFRMLLGASGVLRDSAEHEVPLNHLALQRAFPRQPP